MRVTLELEGSNIRGASYDTYQCPGCVACGQAIVAIVTGKSVDQARAIKHEDLVKYVGPLPRHRQICYGLTVLALAEAVKQLGG